MTYETLMEGLMGYRQSNIPQRSMKIKLLHNYLHMKFILKMRQSLTSKKAMFGITNNSKV